MIYFSWNNKLISHHKRLFTMKQYFTNKQLNFFYNESIRFHQRYSYFFLEFYFLLDWNKCLRNEKICQSSESFKNLSIGVCNQLCPACIYVIKKLNYKVYVTYLHSIQKLYCRIQFRWIRNIRSLNSNWSNLLLSYSKLSLNLWGL